MGSMGEKPELPKPWIKTPLVESKALSRAAGCRIFLKLENLQPSGSFKSRGIGNLIRRTLLTHPTPDLTHFYSSSGGNAGLACVTAAITLGRPATVVVPLSTKPLMVSKILTAGATDVIQRGASWAEADKYLQENILAKDPNGVYVPPFDHPDVWAGAQTIVEEIGEQLGLEGPDALICSVGGGGLFCGMMLGLERAGWGEIDVLAMETRGADSLAESLKAGKLVTLPEITSIATSLGCRRVAAKTFELAQRAGVRSVVLDDADAAMGCCRLADDERILVEASCGVSAAVCYDGRLKKLLPHLTEQSKVVIVVCGGSNITFELLGDYKWQYWYVEQCTANNELVPSTPTAPHVHLNELSASLEG